MAHGSWLTASNAPPLYDPFYEHAACGLGFVARVDGRKSREIVEQGLDVLQSLAHRGATGADAETGDGAGIMLQVPHDFLHRECHHAGLDLPAVGHYGVGTLFLSADPELRRRCERELEIIAAEEGQPVLGWRDVPIHPDRIGTLARSVMPCIRQVFISRNASDEGAFERRLYIIRRRLHWAVMEQYGDANVCYVVSLSSRTLVYKGLLQGPQLPRFYPDLTDPLVTSALALVHSRFSTNTLGSWPLAHPFRYVAHNGEINALRGNINWLRAREHEFQTALFPRNIEDLGPIVQPGGSDTSAFDNALEFLVLAGRSLPHAIMTMIPEPWENDEGMDPDRRAFYQYTTSLVPPWDGPAAIAFSDGRVVGATLDRNGLRPARYSITRDGLVILASEEGVLPVPPEDVISRWRLQPGRMLLVDTVRGRVLGDSEAKQEVVSRRPYRKWAEEILVPIARLPEPAQHSGASETGEGSWLKAQSSKLLTQQRAFGFTLEDLKIVLTPMAETGKEADGSMGTDTPLAVLSERPQLLFNYFKQLFAQVSNPPIDPLREGLVMSLVMSLGPEPNLMHERPEGCRQVLLDGPILTDKELDTLKALDGSYAPSLRTVILPLLFDAQKGAAALEQSLQSLCSAAEAAIEDGATILILSDRGVDTDHAPIPSLLATAAVHHHLVRTHKRTRAGLVVETAEAREVHHIALLIGYGAVAINPYLALETVSRMAEMGQFAGVSAEGARANFVNAIHKGLLKVISKMGISTLVSYCGAQVFEAVGLDRALIERYFTGTASRIGGAGIPELAREVLARHMHAFRDDEVGPIELGIGGEYQLRQGGEYHQWNPESIASLQRAVQTESYDSFKDFSRHFDGEAERTDVTGAVPLATLRSLFDFVSNPIPLEEVEPVEEIVQRFSTGAMSFGSLSKEAHETLAVAMNRMGGKSNSGEGGEDPERYQRDPNGSWRRSAIKQVASARFGVNTHYLVNADMLQIKMAQGAKPGEGGQLPGHKVSPEIARARYATPGVGLISPPPHHDIYSIEDLAQLIHDLKNVNPAAQISVKLVSEVGVGTIAAGVAKARADHITIAGYDGGTGASPLSSIRHAGLPWELGLAEAQQVLVANDLRGRVRLQADGGLKTGRDVVVAALLGAEEFAFSTAPLVATGCIMMRACHLNTCPVGIATQNPELRRRFAGKPEHVINYFFFLAQEVRELMAELGFRRFDEMVGKANRLETRCAVDHWKAKGLDLSPLVAVSYQLSAVSCQLDDAGSAAQADAAEPVPTQNSKPRTQCSMESAPTQPTTHPALHHIQSQDHHLEDVLDHQLIELAHDALDNLQPVQIELPISNTNRTVGGMLSGEIARRYGAEGLPDGTITVYFRGTAGQSFGAWGAHGLTFVLDGETNDHAGKGLSGARLVVKPPVGAGYDPERSIVVGNVALYGATAGEAYFRGVAGERFAVRNSGARAVVEGCGDHGCEYMTGGVVLVLGTTGRNFAAGMSGGSAFVLDMWGRFPAQCNLDMVGLEPVEHHEDVALVREMLQRHLEWTGSTVAQRVLANWHEYLPRLVKVMPHDLKRVMAESTDLQEQAG